MRALLVINARRDQSADAEIDADRRPRQDFRELQRRLSADVLDLSVLRGRWRVVERLLGTAATQALVAWSRTARYDAIFVDRETTGGILAALCRLRRKRPRLVMIGHLLTSPRKRLLFRLLGIGRAVDCVVVHSSTQQHVAIAEIGLHPNQVALVPYQTDERFWRPQRITPKRQICSAGLEYRDYATLIEAVRGLDVDVVIAAASHWSKHYTRLAEQPLPPNVRVVSLDYLALRRLYAESLFVVVPLHDVENQAGITTILEAMAMEKAVVASHTRGQTDVVRDRRRLSRTDPERRTQPDWAQALGTTAETTRGQTGIYVRPGDPDELRRAIEYLLAQPGEARIMGANGRALVTEALSLDQFVSRIAKLMGMEKSLRALASMGVSRSEGVS